MTAGVTEEGGRQGDSSSPLFLLFCQCSRCSPFLSSLGLADGAGRGSVVAPNLPPLPSPPLPSQAGSGAKSPPGRIRCINSRPGIPAGRGFAVQGLCEVVWTEEGLRDMLALRCSSQPIWGVLGVVWLCMCGCISNGWSHRPQTYQRWERNSVYPSSLS